MYGNLFTYIKISSISLSYLIDAHLIHVQVGGVVNGHSGVAIVERTERSEICGIFFERIMALTAALYK
jgi:hypothetical protein